MLWTAPGVKLPSYRKNGFTPSLWRCAGDDYKLTIDSFNSTLSTLGDAFLSSTTIFNHNGMRFSTRFDSKHNICKLA